MKTVYILQHRAEGRITSHVFANPPTQAQKDAIISVMDKRHRQVLAAAPVDPDEKDLWPKVIEVQLVETTDEILELEPKVAEVPRPELDAEQAMVRAEFEQVRIAGIGNVTVRGDVP